MAGSEQGWPSPATPSTDPDVRHYRIRLLPWVVDARRCCLLDVPARARWACLSGSASGACCVRASSPRPASLAPSPPPPVPRLRPATSSLLRGCLTSRIRSSPAYVLWTSRCGLRHLRSQTDVGSPGSRVGWFRACLGSPTAQGPFAPRALGSKGVAFRFRQRRRHPGRPGLTPQGVDFAARWPARTFPCQRFGDGIAPASA